MSRSFYVGEDVKQEDIRAKYESGVLTLNIPKAEEKKRRLKKRNILPLSNRQKLITGRGKNKPSAFYTMDFKVRGNILTRLVSAMHRLAGHLSWGEYIG